MSRTAHALRARSHPGVVDGDEVLEAARRKPLALFLDVDGTLLDIAPTPGAVTVSQSLKDSLAAAEAKLSGALALVSGRTIADLDDLFAPLRLATSGVHGAETRLAQSVEAVNATGALSDRSWRALTQALANFPLLLIENKQYSFCVHYRLCPELAAQLRTLLDTLLKSALWTGIGIAEAHYAFELKPPTFDKGRAIRRFLARPPFQGRTPVFIGDDLTDESGFAVVSEAGGLAYSVAQLRRGATAYFETPADVRGWLANFAWGDR